MVLHSAWQRYQRILETEFGKVRSLGTVYYLLHQMGYPRPQHRQADLEAQEAFKKVPREVAEIVSQQPGKQLRVFFQNEACFGQQGTITRVWAPTGTRPRAVRQTEYNYMWVLGAVCPETGQAEGLLSPRLNTGVINMFLEQFSQTLAEDEHAVIVWDGAGFHRAKTLRVPENITLVKLSPYSPELNSIENLWHFLKSHHWSNRVHKDFEHLMDSAEQAWKRVCLDTETIKTVCNATYAKSADLN